MLSSKFANLRQVVTLPIAMIDREYQEREEHPPNRVSHFFTFSPSSASPPVVKKHPSRSTRSRTYASFPHCDIALAVPYFPLLHQSDSFFASDDMQ